MRPEIGNIPWPGGLLRIGQQVIAALAIDQQRAARTPRQDLLRDRVRAAAGMVEDHDRSIAAALSALIAQHHLEPTLAHRTRIRRQHRHGGLIHLQPVSDFAR